MPSVQVDRVDGQTADTLANLIRDTRTLVRERCISNGTNIDLVKTICYEILCKTNLLLPIYGMSWGPLDVKHVSNICRIFVERCRIKCQIFVEYSYSWHLRRILIEYVEYAKYCRNFVEYVETLSNYRIFVEYVKTIYPIW